MIKVKDLVFEYIRRDEKDEVIGVELAVDHLSFQVKKGEFVAVMGPSGSGKTTLLNCISCFIPHESGSICLGGQDLSGLQENQLARVRNEKLGFVFQDFMLLDGLTVRENILVPRIIQEKVESDAEELADKLLALFGIASVADKYPADGSCQKPDKQAPSHSCG